MGDTDLLSEEAWDSNDESCEEQDSHNGECKDPLEGDGLGKELANTERGTENTECESHGVILDLVSIFKQRVKLTSFTL